MLLKVLKLLEYKDVVSIAAITYSDEGIIVKTLVLSALVYLTNSNKYSRYDLSSYANTLYDGKRLTVLIRRYKYLLLRLFYKDIFASYNTNIEARLVYILLITRYNSILLTYSKIALVLLLYIAYVVSSGSNGLE